MNQPLDLSPIITPSAPSWWPLAWGWWASHYHGHCSDRLSIFHCKTQDKRTNTRRTKHLLAFVIVSLQIPCLRVQLKTSFVRLH